jgi:hypothetical protein
VILGALVCFEGFEHLFPNFGEGRFFHRSATVGFEFTPVGPRSTTTGKEVLFFPGQGDSSFRSSHKADTKIKKNAPL